MPSAPVVQDSAQCNFIGYQRGGGSPRATLWHDLALYGKLPPGSINLAHVRTASAARSALREQFKACDEKNLDQLVHRNHVEWLQTVHEGELHLVVRHDHYPSIAVYNTETRAVMTFEQVSLENTVKCLLPRKADQYTVYQFPEGTDWEPEGELRAVIESQPLEDLPVVNHGSLISKRYPWGFVKGELQFVIVPQEDDIPQPLTFSRRRRIYFDRTPAKAPSSEAEPSQFSKAQRSEHHRIYCGRPYHRSTPPSLLDETLCQLRCNLESITPTPKDIQCYEALRTNAVGTFTEERLRQEMFSDILAKGRIVPQRADRGFIGGTSFHDDGDLRVTCLDVTLLYYVQDIKLEIGSTKAEPYIEAIHYWLENVRTFFDSPSRDNDAAAQLNFPAVLVLHFGAYLAVAAAVYGNEPNVEHLCCIPLHAHTTNEAELRAGERALTALRVALHSLRERYPTMPIKRGPRADFPFRDFYAELDGTPHPFEYISAIDDKRIFRVSEGGTRLCVKFSKRYSTEAHEVAHAAGFAPKLIAMNMVYDWIMVVMEDKSDEYSNTMWDIKRAKIGEKREEEAKKGKKKAAEKEKAFHTPAFSLEEAQDEVKAKLAHLHDKGFVHGDLRDVNVIVRNEGVSGDDPGILIVDWDWAGRAGQVTYPRGINTQVARPADALAGEDIKAEHDVWMADRLADPL
ncbi:hypothetical protein OH76DRAFT_1399616 [Lentinus brumalis]|uniref:Protein kinase domain-containing protein n=1 Tax=Lentinus brumalis TaxID=2498619 RepID=A0A371DKH5_9APHY|nr:hypothetical protein OH76DRAFT_1399616 [Polyporus brumalis]